MFNGALDSVRAGAEAADVEGVGAFDPQDDEKNPATRENATKQTRLFISVPPTSKERRQVGSQRALLNLFIASTPAKTFTSSRYLTRSTLGGAQTALMTSSFGQ
jgi:hypothetical protein